MYTKIRHTLLVLAAIVVLAVGILPAKTALAEGEYVPGAVIVVYEKSAAPVEQTNAELAERGYEVAQQTEPTSLSAQSSDPVQTDAIAVAEKRGIVFDGNNHKISNFKAGAPLFYILVGSVENLTIENAEIDAEVGLKQQ